MFGFLGTMLGGVAAGVGFAVGVGVTMAGAERLRPVVRQAMKGCMAAADRAREATAGLGETLQDIYAEAKAEREAERGGSQQNG